MENDKNWDKRYDSEPPEITQGKNYEYFEKNLKNNTGNPRFLCECISFLDQELNKTDAVVTEFIEAVETEITPAQGYTWMLIFLHKFKELDNPTIGE